jgi:isoquinoline 1-oxidoreductase
VKYVYSREDQFTRTGFMKLSSAFEIESGFDSAGILRAMKCICYQNSGGAVWLLYEIPDLLVTRYDADRPVNHVAMRAVDMVQGMFALESHLDMVADAAGKDPLEFRLKNARATGLTEALQTGAQAFGYTGRKTGANRGTGISIARWGDSRGALFAEVEVNTNSGKITVTRLVLAADVGTVVSSRSLIANLRGGLIMGLGYALMEEVKMDGHGINTKSLSEYSIPRFSDIPDIRIELYNRGSTEKFLGAGELPVPPVAPAIANAVFSATGKRIRNLPMIPSRVID